MTERMAIDSPPADIEHLLIAVGRDHFGLQQADAEELAGKQKKAVMKRLTDELSAFNAMGRHHYVALNSSSEYLVQGSAFIENGDSDELKAVKERRSKIKQLLAGITAVTPKQFEALCSGVLSILGVKNPTVTKSSADQGLDFYGKLELSSFLLGPARSESVTKVLNVWLIGQAKHYPKNKIATMQLRELVGAITLARAGAYSTDGAFSDLLLRVCDPVFFLFFTTGRLTEGGWKLLERSGVVGMDGEMIALMLAEEGVAMENGVFSEAELAAWIGQFSQ